MEDASRYYPSTGQIATVRVSLDELDEFLNEQNAAIEIDGGLYWNKEMSANGVLELLEYDPHNASAMSGATDT
ncbi:hypothetical protein [Haladaptatus sp. DFWS20]|uniref:hypothetical protein n=1 Tax=Haladaptatus sp. DFWS20 TaxID=3403467 RepID=UPI003EB7DA8B